MTPGVVHLTFRNAAGSVEHYWHFMMGAYLPLIAWSLANPELASSSQLLVRSCGPMDRLFQELRWSNFVVLPKQDHAALPNTAKEDMRLVELPGMDLPWLFDRPTIVAASSWLTHQWLLPETTQEINLVIDRGPPDPFYLGPETEFLSAGNQRRSIPNLAAIAEEIRKVHGSTRFGCLEPLTLEDQARLFRSAKRVVFQHGAAMANLIFCRPGTQVLEIMPKTITEREKQKAVAATLCQLLGLRYTKLWQEGNHDAVAVQDVMTLLL